MNSFSDFRGLSYIVMRVDFWTKTVIHAQVGMIKIKLGVKKDRKKENWKCSSYLRVEKV